MLDRIDRDLQRNRFSCCLIVAETIEESLQLGGDKLSEPAIVEDLPGTGTGEECNAASVETERKMHRQAVVGDDYPVAGNIREMSAQVRPAHKHVHTAALAKVGDALPVETPLLVRPSLACLGSKCDVAPKTRAGSRCWQKVFVASESSAKRVEKQFLVGSTVPQL